MNIRLGDNSFVKCKGQYGYIANGLTGKQYTFDENGKMMLGMLSRQPQDIREICSKLAMAYDECNVDELADDVSEFFKFLSDEGLVLLDEQKEEIAKNGQASVPPLTALTFELTKRCNERCVHCYLPNELKRQGAELSIEVVKRVIDEFHSCGGRKVALTGGEALLAKHFEDVMQYAGSLGLDLVLLSNLTRLTENQIQRLRHYNITDIQTSLYGSNAAIHDGITQYKGAFEKTTTAIERLLDNGLSVSISCPVMKENKDDITNILDYGRLKGLEVRLELNITACMDKSAANLSHRLDIDELEQFLRNLMQYDKDATMKMLTRHKQRYDEAYDFVDYLNAPICSIGQDALYVTAEGNVASCPSLQGIVLGNVNTESIKEIWQSHQTLKHFRGIKEGTFPKCVDCCASDYCVRCVARNYTDTGDCMKFPSYACQMAHLSKRLVEKYQ